MKIEENFNLAPLTTFRIGGPARYFAECNSFSAVKEALSFAREKGLSVFILGGGSNVLVSDTGFAGLVLKINIKGQEIISEGDSSVIIKVGAGESLDEVIGWTVEKALWGIENLSFVPGTVGGAIYMNAGCYGEEIAEVIDRVTVLDIKNLEIKTFLPSECDFTYRHSRFNTYDKGKFVIIEAELKLNKSGVPNLKYADLERWFEGKREPTISEIRQALITIRTNKGQDTNKVWSAGSFFRNFNLSRREFEELISKVKEGWGDELAHDLETLVDKVKAPSDGDKIKVPAAFILDKMFGLKGFKIGGAMHSPVQVLNLVNSGTATSEDIIALHENAQKLVYEKLGLELINEPEFVGF